MLVIALLTLAASTIAALVALNSLRKPKIEVERMDLQAMEFSPLHGSVVEEQKKHEGAHPDSLLIVTLRNKGNVPALRVSGSLHIMNPAFLVPTDYPGYENFTITIAAAAPAIKVSIPVSDDHRAPPESSIGLLAEQLSFWIPVNVYYSPDDKASSVLYRFEPENGKPTQGEWLVSYNTPPAPDLDAPTSGPVQDSMYNGAPSFLQSVLNRLPFWRK